MQSRTDTTLLIVRVALGVVILGHGVQKLLGWFGGFGYEGTMNYFTNTVGLPDVFGFLIIICESLGMIALILGLFGRLASAGLVVIMIGAFFVDHLQYGFFMDWFGTKKGEGYEFDILVVGVALSILINGTGAYSLDKWILARFQAKRKKEVLA